MHFLTFKVPKLDMQRIKRSAPLLVVALQCRQSQHCLQGISRVIAAVVKLAGGDIQHFKQHSEAHLGQGNCVCLIDPPRFRMRGRNPSNPMHNCVMMNRSGRSTLGEHNSLRFAHDLARPPAPPTQGPPCPQWLLLRVSSHLTSWTVP
ncbi:hypothetical protein Vretimale_4437 [Volvox reticuliferus]|uniref:Uncharacterized protein n=1 Tax=Volvox reticuliferus TaxID=1737510 RepID=A0A8J4DB29_9CHLO|nr:hypothetical protein Vretimale_4437 [Volvox reticuliferus]